MPRAPRRRRCPPRRPCRARPAAATTRSASTSSAVWIGSSTTSIPRSHFAEFNEAYQEFFTPPYPVRTTVGSQLADILVEIDVVAALPQR
ncbi:MULTISPECIES: RidA family protein [Microbacterium]|uniref:RidA family protein n=1 Tax=Microbacterium TaxID=33882 RepID=UPI00217DD542|nr:MULTISPECIES: hypothetical protein [Microbacterium]